MLNQMMKSVLEQDRAAVVLCDLNHIIVYMNPAAQRRYAKRGGANLIGKSLLDCHNEQSNQMIKKVTAWFAENPDHNIIYTFHSEKENMDVYMVALRDENKKLIGYYEKHEHRDRERANVYNFSQEG